MAESDRMPKVNFEKDGLDKSALQYIKKIEQQNRERLVNLKKVRSRNIKTGLALGALVIGIYSYSFAAVKQETFLDDFNEPERERI